MRARDASPQWTPGSAPGCASRSPLRRHLLASLEAPLDLVATCLLRLELRARAPRLLDREIRRGRSALLEQPERDEAGQSGQEEQQERDDPEADPGVVVPAEHVVQEPGEPVEEHCDPE